MAPVTWSEDGSVVVPGIDAPSTVACVRSLGRRGVRTIVVSSDETTPAARSTYCDEFVRVPSPHDDLLAYRDALLSLAHRPDVETIIPVREPDVYVLSKYRDDFREHLSTPWPTFDTLASVQDRKRLFEAAEEAGVGAPTTTLFDAPPDGDREWIVKPRYSILGDEYVEELPPEACIAPPSTRYLRPDAEPDVDAIHEEMGHVPIVQEYVETTDEYGFFALYDRGEPLATFQHRQRRGYSYAGGPSAYRESVDIPALETAGRDLLDHLEWHGLAMVEFLRDETTGEFKLMEINPRFWSSLPFSVQTGADFPRYYWQLANGRADRIDHDYRADIGGHLIRGELCHLYTILACDFELVDRPSFTATLGEMSRSMIDEPRFDYLSRDDPRPFVRDSLNTVDAIADRVGGGAGLKTLLTDRVTAGTDSPGGDESVTTDADGSSSAVSVSTGADSPESDGGVSTGGDGPDGDGSVSTGGDGPDGDRGEPTEAVSPDDDGSVSTGMDSPGDDGNATTDTNTPVGEGNT